MHRKLCLCHNHDHLFGPITIGKLYLAHVQPRGKAMKSFYMANDMGRRYYYSSLKMIELLRREEVDEWLSYSSSS